MIRPIPLILLLLGIQVPHTNASAAISRVWTGTVLRPPFIGLGVALRLAFDDPTVARVFVLEAVMPAAVTPIIFVVEFASESWSGEITVPNTS